MATIIIGANASFAYPLTSDNVFGPPSDFLYAISATFAYTSWELDWFAGLNDPPPQIIAYDRTPPPAGSPGHGFYEGRYTHLASNGIDFVPTYPVAFDAYFPGQSYITRYNQPNLAPTLLSGADNITNLSAAGALLTGYAGADTIVGGAGDDTLDGGTGTDSLAGGLGDDLYLVDNSDLVVELAGQGFDTVLTANTYVAPSGAFIERVVATGVANIAMTGNGKAMELVGNSGINTLDDGGGMATLTGGAGNDIYVVRNALTQIVEAPGEGYDGVRTDLSAYVLGANLETLSHLGATAFQGVGNALSNALTGGTGSDTLNGAGGNDVLTGGLGSDHFRFDGLTFGQDQITDFLSGTDVIELSGAGFGLPSLQGVQLVADGAVTAAGQATLHYYANGGLSFDANGASAGDAVFFATLSGHPSLAISDFALV